MMSVSVCACVCVRVGRRIRTGGVAGREFCGRAHRLKCYRIYVALCGSVSECKGARGVSVLMW